MTQKDLWRDIIKKVITELHLPSPPDLNTVELAVQKMAADKNYAIEYTSPSEAKQFCQEVIDCLNKRKGGKPFKVRYPSAITNSILQIKNSSYTLEDILYVIDKKCNDWLGTNFEQYLRPKTLFLLSNFENYFGQLDTNAKQQPTNQTGFEKLISSASAAATKVAGAGGEQH